VDPEKKKLPRLKRMTEEEQKEQYIKNRDAIRNADLKGKKNENNSTRDK
jgi:hypothetical protein